MQVIDLSGIEGYSRFQLNWGLSHRDLYVEKNRWGKAGEHHPIGDTGLSIRQHLSQRKPVISQNTSRDSHLRIVSEDHMVN